ncbi:unnamed protein product [Mytilus edulis]|uniref:Uncharacterized protein n=1 Tax=Mytilus edulis TaxID=6550 RepID=A0A8S3QYU1_MYTED|nr:unnamed protein product [Mytilus edulis]
MAHFDNAKEILESEKKGLKSHLKKDSHTAGDKESVCAKTEKMKEDLYRRNYEDLYRRTEAATKKLLGEFKKEAESILELNFWKDIENMRGDYHYPEEEGVPCEEIDHAKEDIKTNNEQDDISNELLVFDEPSNHDQHESEKNWNESDKKLQIQNIYKL